MRITSGTDLEISCQASDTGYNLTWTAEGKTISTSASSAVYQITYSHQSKAVLKVQTFATVANSRQYVCEVRDSYGIPSDEIYIHIDPDEGESICVIQPKHRCEFSLAFPIGLSSGDTAAIILGLMLLVVLLFLARNVLRRLIAAIYHR